MAIGGKKIKGKSERHNDIWKAENAGFYLLQNIEKFIYLKTRQGKLYAFRDIFFSFQRWWPKFELNIMTIKTILHDYRTADRSFLANSGL